MKYPKIQTLFKRDENTHKIIEGEYSREEFDNIRRWVVTEKIDGTNCRVFYNPNSVSQHITFGGRTDNAQIPTSLLKHLQEIFTVKNLCETFPDEDIKNVILFGEGYGPKIQKGGGRYRDDVSFILFDVWVDGWWLSFENVLDIGNKLEIDVVPTVGDKVMTVDDIIYYVKGQPLSQVAKDRTLIMEGVVAKSFPLVLFREGTPVVWKLKVKDYEQLDG